MNTTDSKAREYALECRMSDPDEYYFQTVLTTAQLDMIPPGWEGVVTFTLRPSLRAPTNKDMLESWAVMA